MPLEKCLQDEQANDAAFSLGVPPELSGHITRLFKGVRAFGSDPALVVRLLESAGIGRGSYIADLACGKGSLALAAAQKLGCRAVGLDIYEPFIDEAERSAKRRGLSERVKFERGQIEAWRPGRQFDAVVII